MHTFNVNTRVSFKFNAWEVLNQNIRQKLSITKRQPSNWQTLIKTINYAIPHDLVSKLILSIDHQNTQLIYSQILITILYRNYPEQMSGFDWY